jgi:uroporphyrin-III C-methyltransferase/precorrin-2 dehydrogenase/sirohydrochlorin ferrochelatase
MRYFPLFADLRGRRVLLVGGGVVAERKARLLVEAGAKVDVVAARLNEWFATETTRAGQMRHIATAFDESQLESAVLVVAATDDVDVNSEVSRAAERRGILANVVDDAGRSSFIVPAIVDRSPLVIAISTGGAAPVLARLVREKLESLIDESYGTLAGLLDRWRARIRAAFPAVGARRRFYESVVRGRVSELIRDGRPAEAERELLVQVDAGPSSSHVGSVVLVGAGPGDPGLLTLRALRALQEADVILHDRLVSREILDLARRDAERIPVGKEAGHHSVPQPRINELLAEHAQAGKRVVRLKGGDPFVFGRGGEELEYLREQQIPFEVVPGITAASACGAYAGIPLTHRDHSQSLRLVTAHCDPTKEGLDWPALAAERQTLAFYMGVARLGAVAEQLIAHGRSAGTPVAIVENGSRIDQRVTLAQLHELAAIAELGDVRSPALLIVGEVAALGAKLHWFGEAPRLWASASVAREPIEEAA